MNVYKEINIVEYYVFLIQRDVHVLNIRLFKQCHHFKFYLYKSGAFYSVDFSVVLVLVCTIFNVWLFYN